MDQNDDSIIKILSKIDMCDVVLTYSGCCFVGLYYDGRMMEAPVVMCRNSGCNSLWIKKIAEANNVICIEDKPLAYALFEDTKESSEIQKKYWKAVAVVYGKLSKIYKDQSDSNITFHEKLDYDVYRQIVQLEHKYYKRVEKQYLKECSSLQAKSCDVTKLLSAIKEFVDLYNLEFKESRYSETGANCYQLESKLTDYNYEFWQMVIINDNEEKIYIGSRNYFKEFDFSEIQQAIVFLKILVEKTNTNLKYSAKKYCKEFDINPKIYNLSVDSIKTLLEINYNCNFIEYGCDTSEKTVFMVYLREPDQNTMYEICITYKEFLRSPEEFKKFILSPKEQRKWNFWSHKKKYNQKYFEEKFQTIER